MRYAAAILLLALQGLPASGQTEGVPLIRVYIDTPYYYELVAYNTDGEQRQTFELVAEGKEVGAATIDLDCASGDYTQTIAQDWTGTSGDFVPAAVMAYRNLFCSL